MSSSLVFDLIWSIYYEHLSREWVESLWPDQINWWGWLHAHPEGEVFDKIQLTDNAGWTSIQIVSSSWSFTNQFTKHAEHQFSRCIPLHSWNWSNQLMSLAEHPFRKWVLLQCDVIWSTNKVGWTHPGGESPFSVWLDLINRWGWLNTHLVGESLSSVWPNPINWQGALNTHPVGESFSSVWSDLINLWDWLDTYSECESPINVWPDPINLQGWLNIQDVSSSLVFHLIWSTD